MYPNNHCLLSEMFHNKSINEIVSTLFKSINLRESTDLRSLRRSRMVVLSEVHRPG